MSRLYIHIKQWPTTTHIRRCSFAILILVCNLSLLAQSVPRLEYQLKAVFLFNFTQFVDWPEESFSSNSAPLVLGVVGDNPFGSYLQTTVSGEKKQGHPVIVKYFHPDDEEPACHILYINIRDAKKRREVIETAKNKNILTVGDAADFIKDGGMIRFFTKSDKIKFEINPAACRNAGLEPSSKLLRVAQVTP